MQEGIFSINEHHLCADISSLWDPRFKCPLRWASVVKWVIKTHEQPQRSKGLKVRAVALFLNYQSERFYVNKQFFQFWCTKAIVVALCAAQKYDGFRISCFKQIQEKHIKQKRIHHSCRKKVDS